MEDLKISLTPKVHIIIDHIVQFCTEKNLALVSIVNKVVRAYTMILKTLLGLDLKCPTIIQDMALIFSKL